MKLIVKPHKIEIAKEPINEKEINITRCEFEFADEIGNDFVKEAFFTYNGATYKEIIVNNQCDIPYEVLIEKGQVELGVVAYKIENDVEIKRYNPSPVYFNTWDGSLKEQYENSEPITPTDKEQIEQIVADAVNSANTAVENANIALNQANNLDLDVSKEDKTATVSITKKDGTQKSVNIFDGVSLQFMWRGTSLGVKTDDMEEYVFVDLQGIQGQPGPQGEAFQIKKTYATTQLMIADYDNMNINDYVMISGDIETQENATLWVKTETEDPTYRWVYLADFSGASGIQGETGATPQISIGTVTSGQTPSVTISGTAEHPVFNFVLVKGDTGATGQTGATGATGNGISSIEQTSATTSEKNFRINYTNGGHFDYSLENGEVTQNQLDEVQAELDRYKLIENALPHVSGTGTSIMIDNTAKSPMSLDLAPSELEQDTTTGKNLYNKYGDFNYPTNAYENATSLQADGTIKTTANAQSNASRGIRLSLKQNTTYVLSGKLVSSTGTGMSNIARVRTMGYGSNWSAIVDYSIGTTGNFSFTFNSGDKTDWFISLNALGTTGGDYEAIYDEIQVEEGSTATTYEPYSGGIAQPNPSYPSEVHSVSGDNSIVLQNKNLLDRTKATLGKSIYKSGTMLNDTNSDVSDYIDVGGISSVVISFTTSLDSFSWGICCYDENKNALSDYGANGVGKSAAASGRLVQDLITNNIKYLRFSYPKNSTDVMIEVNTTKTSYLPHQEQVKPITLPVENKFNVNGTYTNTGCNASVSNGEITQTNTGTYSRTTWTISDLIVGEKYTLSFSYENNSSSTIQAMIRNSTDDTTITYTEATTNTSGKDSLTFTATETTHKIRLYSNATNTSNSTVVKFSEIQFEPGDKANSYWAYGTTPIEYCKIGTYSDHFFKAVDGDKIYDTLDSATKQTLTSGKWYIQKNIGKVVFDGTRTWSVVSTGETPYYRYRYVTEAVASSTTGLYCNMFKQGNISTTGSVLGCTVFSTGEVRAREQTMQTAENWMTYLGTHNMILYYVLATPTYILLNDTLQAQLNDIKDTLLSYQGQTNITQANNDLPFVMTGRALRDMSDIYNL